jgi:hypothetical protein
MTTQTTVKKKTKTQAISLDNSNTLEALAAEIRKLHAETEHAVEEASRIGCAAVSSAIQMGNAMNKAKKIVGHGNFLAWLDKHCRIGKPPKAISPQYVRRLMALAESDSSKGNHGFLLTNAKSVREAFVMLGIIPEIQVQTERPQRQILSVPLSTSAESKTDSTSLPPAQSDPVASVPQPHSEQPSSMAPALVMIRAALADIKARLNGLDGEHRTEAYKVIRDETGAWIEEGLM